MFFSLSWLIVYVEIERIVQKWQSFNAWAGQLAYALCHLFIGTSEIGLDSLLWHHCHWLYSYSYQRKLLKDNFFAILSVMGFNFCYRYMIESPRWLINRGRLARAAYYLNRIAKINKKDVILNEKVLRSMLPSEEPEKVYGMLSLFSGFRLAKNTTILIICW